MKSKLVWNLLISAALLFSLLAGPVAAQAADGADSLTLYSSLLAADSQIGMTAAPGEGFESGSAWRSNKNTVEFYLIPQALGLGDITVGDIESVSYATKKLTVPEGSADVDFGFYIYTEVDEDADSWWYGKRLTAEPYLARDYDAPADQWNVWTTAGEKNVLTFYDTNNNDGVHGTCTDPTLAELLAGPYTWPNGKTVDYSSEKVMAFKFGTGSAWSAGFDGLLDSITIETTTKKVTIDLEAALPDVVYVDDDWAPEHWSKLPFAGEDLYPGSNAFWTIQDAVAAVAPGGTVIVNPGTYEISAETGITLRKPVNIQGAGLGQTIINVTADTVAGNDYAFLFINGSQGSTLEGVEIFKADNLNQNIIGIQASDVKVKNISVHGAWMQGDSSTTRALEVSGGLTGVVIEDSTFYGLRQPGYLNNRSKIEIKNCYVYRTRGWVLEGADVTFTGNTWGTGDEVNAVDIAILSVTDAGLYPDLLAVSAANNNAVVEDQRSGLMTHVWVDDDAAGSLNGYPISPFKTIQEAVAKAVPGGTVYVAEGTYTGQVVIDKDLTLLGSGSPTIQAVESMPVCFNNTKVNTRPVVCVKDADVTIDGFTIDGMGLGKKNSKFYGIALNNAGGTIQNSTIVDVRDEPLSGDQYGIAIYLYNNSASGRTFNVVGNTISGFQKNALFIDGAGQVLTINVSDNTITGAGGTTALAQNGIQINGSNTSGVVANNELTGFLYTGSNWVSTAIMAFSAGDVDVLNNTVKEAHTAIFYVDTNGKIAGNQLELKTGATYSIGISASANYASSPVPDDGPVSVEISDNEVIFVGTKAEGDYILGIEGYLGSKFADQSLSANIHDNTVIGFDMGISIAGEMPGLNNVSVTNNILDNEVDILIDQVVEEGAITSIEGNQLSSLTNNQTFSVDAAKNYWGSAGGPLAGSLEGDVVVAPWCVDEACTEFAPKEGEVVLPEEASVEEIQAAINNAPEGTTIVLPEGTFTNTGGFEIKRPGLTIKLSSGTIIQNNSPCFVVEADYTRIISEPGAVCKPTNGDHGIVVKDGVTDLVISGLEIDGADGTDGIHFEGAVTDVVIVNNLIYGLSGNAIEFTAAPAGVVEIQGNLFKDNGEVAIVSPAQINAQYNSWGAYDAPVIDNVDTSNNTHVDLYLESSGTPWVDQVVKDQQIIYTVYGDLKNVMGASFTLNVPEGLTYQSHTLGGVFENEDLTVEDGKLVFVAYQMGAGAAAVSEKEQALFSVTFTGSAAGKHQLTLGSPADKFSMAPAEGSSNWIYANSLEGAEVNVINLPSLTSENLSGPFITGVEQEYQVTLTNPDDGGSFSNVLVRFRLNGADASTIASLKYMEYDALGNELGWKDWTLNADADGLYGEYGPAAGFPMPNPYAATSRFLVTFAEPGVYPAELDVVDVLTETVLAELDADVDVRANPVFTSDDLDGPFFVSYPQEFHVTLTNPTNGLDFSAVLVHLRVKGAALSDIDSLEYWETEEEDGQPTGWRTLGLTQDGADLVGYYGPSTGFPLPIGYTAESLFRVKFAKAGSYTVELSLVDKAVNDRVLTTFTQTAAVNPAFTVTATVSMQGRIDRAGVEMTLTGLTERPFAYGPFTATSEDRLSSNLSFALVVDGEYEITTNQARYLNVSGKTVTISAGKQSLNQLQLKGGNAVQDDVININDASLIANQYGYKGIEYDGDVNFSGEVDIFDLAMVGGNFDLTAAAAYADWTP